MSHHRRLTHLTPKARAHRCRPALQHLEDRTVPTTVFGLSTPDVIDVTSNLGNIQVMSGCLVADESAPSLVEKIEKGVYSVTSTH